MWGIWWIWVAIAVALGALELLAPAWLFLGFALGAGAVALLLLVGGPMSAALSGSFALTLLVFAVLSLIAWLILRRAVGVRDGQVKHWTRDINED